MKRAEQGEKKRKEKERKEQKRKEEKRREEKRREEKRREEKRREEKRREEKRKEKKRIEQDRIEQQVEKDIVGVYPMDRSVEKIGQDGVKIDNMNYIVVLEINRQSSRSFSKTSYLLLESKK